MLTDTGPLVALLDHRDQNHVPAQRSFTAQKGKIFTTTCPCMTEAMQLLSRYPYNQAQDQLAQMVLEGSLTVHYPAPSEIHRIFTLMDQYQDRPMSYADASLAAAAETRGDTEVFTFDSDFHFYRPADGSVLEVLP